MGRTLTHCGLRPAAPDREGLEDSPPTYTHTDTHTHTHTHTHAHTFIHACKYNHTRAATSSVYLICSGVCGWRKWWLGGCVGGGGFSCLGGCVCGGFTGGV